MIESDAITARIAIVCALIAVAILVFGGMSCQRYAYESREQYWEGLKEGLNHK